MTEDKRFNLAFYDKYDGTFSIQDKLYWEENKHLHSLDEIIDLLNELSDKCDFLEIENESLEDGATKYAERYHEVLKENEQLKEGMIGVVDRYIKNVECNPPSSAHTYMKIKGALVNIREDLRDLIGDFE